MVMVMVVVMVMVMVVVMVTVMVIFVIASPRTIATPRVSSIVTKYQHG
jgi:hypothetical protein